MIRGEAPIRLPPSERPILLAVVDTEEEFDWGRGPDRGATSVAAMREVHRAQEICDRYGVKPTYVVDFPVATQAEGYGPLKEIQDSGRCTIGAHLHPWVNPPLDEPVTARNSYAGNLAGDLERAKLRVLADAIGASFGRRPVIYKAGRYGVGAGTARLLEGEGFEVDMSVFPSFDSSADGGPDFSRIGSVDPYWFGAGRRLLEVPLTGAFVGFLGALGRAAHALASARPLAALRAPGILARLGAADRLALSPEGFTPAEHVRLVRWLHARGVRVFSWCYHSPSMAVGCTPYVRTEAERSEFLDRFRRFFEFFFGDLGGVTMTPLELKGHLEKRT